MDQRFKRHWETWRKLLAEGKTPADFLQGVSDETLVELLASSEGTALERNIIATELTNRITRLHRHVGDHSDRVTALVEENRASLREAERSDVALHEQTERFRHEISKTSRYAAKGRERKDGW